MSSRSTRSHSSRSQTPTPRSSRSQTPGSRSSRSQTPVPKQSFLSKNSNLLYVYVGLAVFFLIAILFHTISPPEMYTIYSNCTSYAHSTFNKDDATLKAINNCIQENMTKVELIEKLMDVSENIPELDVIDFKIKQLLYYEDDEGYLHSCKIPINTNIFFFVGVILFLVFAILAGMTYFNKQQKIE